MLGTKTNGELGIVVKEWPSKFVEVSVDSIQGFRYSTAVPWLDFHVAVDSLA